MTLCIWRLLICKVGDLDAVVVIIVVGGIYLQLSWACCLGNRDFEAFHLIYLALLR